MHQQISIPCDVVLLLWSLSNCL